jgi:SAM-dependent methyltransferase
MSNETIKNIDDIFNMLDTILKERSKLKWDEFYLDRNKKIPFFVNYPDENLVEYFNKQKIQPGKVLELGCGPGRNAIYLAENSCEVDAVDSSSEAIKWGMERAKEKGLTINFIQKSIFDLDFEVGAYDIVYDSGCFHHIAPHRRISYLNLLDKALKPGGFFALTCFNTGGEIGGADLTDWDVYREYSLKGGLGFKKEKLVDIFSELTPIEIRKMKDMEQQSEMFGVAGLWAALFQKKN